VEVLDGGRVLFTVASDGESVALPEEHEGSLVPGREYRWQIAAVDATGAPIMRGRWRSFAVSGSR
jgi:hypothetical protein